MNKKIQAKDLINVGIFTALYFAVGAAISMLVIIPIFALLILFIWPVLNGIVFMLYTTKVKKFGLITIMGSLSGLLLGLTGMGFYCLPTGILFGFLADIIMKSKAYKSVKINIFGYAVFSLWIMGSAIPIYFLREKTYDLNSTLIGIEYAQELARITPTWSFYALLALCFLGGIIGGIIGKTVMKKHFEKAGIV